MKNKFIYDKLSTIKVEKLRIRAYIGFNKWEQEKLQDLIINYSFKYNTTEAVEKDNIKYGINYKQLTKEIIAIIENQSFLLLETVAEKVWETLKRQPHIIDVEVIVEKPNALRFCDNVMVNISDKDRNNTALISIGSNIEPVINVQKAISELKNLGEIQKMTDFIFTSPLKFENQPDFYNGAVLLKTKKYLKELEYELKLIEKKLKRKRTSNKNAPRTIDLDVVTFNKSIIDKEFNSFDFLISFVKELEPELNI